VNLAELEALFFRAVRGQASTSELDAQFVARGPRTGAGRMRIYNGAYFTRLDGAMVDTFPITRRVLGEPRFEALARRCFMRFPSRRPALEYVGESFPSLLADVLPTGERLAADVAALEWARLEALLAPDCQVLARLNVPDMEPERLRFRWLSSLRFRRSTLAAFRCFHEAEGHTRESQALDGSCPITVALWRRHHGTEYRTLEALEAQVLVDAGESISLLTMCERITDSAPEPVAASLRMIRRWLAQGWIASLELA
jgi:hypothetical protein